MSRPSDFRSDTVTQPTDAMRRAMLAAEVGDDVLDGDPTVRKLEAAAADWLGKRHALYVPSGTMANQVALGAWTRPGDEVVVERDAHVLRWEAGAMGANHGLQAVTLAGERGALHPDEVRAVIRRPYVHAPRTGLVCVEQTHMGAGGAVVPLENLRELRAVTLELGVPLHMDGARLANAVVASGVPAERFAACADSVSLCFSKGLGAPVGSVVCADDDDWRERARVVRKRLGGWMRQSGILAAACVYALERNVGRLSEDHALARALATALDGLPGLSCPPESVETNIVMVEVDGGSGYDAPGLAQALAEHGVRVSNLEPTALRFITHMDVGPPDLERLEQALEKLLGARARQNSGGRLP